MLRYALIASILLAGCSADFTPRELEQRQLKCDVSRYVDPAFVGLLPATFDVGVHQGEGSVAVADGEIDSPVSPDVTSVRVYRTPDRSEAVDFTLHRQRDGTIGCSSPQPLTLSASVDAVVLSVDGVPLANAYVAGCDGGAFTDEQGKVHLDRYDPQACQVWVLCPAAAGGFVDGPTVDFGATTLQAPAGIRAPQADSKLRLAMRAFIADEIATEATAAAVARAASDANPDDLELAIAAADADRVLNASRRDYLRMTFDLCVPVDQLPEMP